MYGIAQWYRFSHASKPLALGATFIPDYAKQLDLSPQKTMDAAINELGIKRFRLVSYWEDIEPTQGHYDFSSLDWQFQKADNANVKISLALGLRQPRWPECHMPEWARKEDKSVWVPQLKDVMTAVVNRYKNNPALQSYELENEYFLKVFGVCTDFSRDRLVSEYNLVKGLDPNHTLIVSMSNNAIGTPIGEPTPDMWAISVYKRVWDQTLTKRYFEYPIPAWYYAFRAGWTQITRGHDSFIHELQAEAWPPNGLDIQKATITEQNKSMNAARLKDRFQYGEATGMRTIDLWGLEWWYWRKEKANDPSLWNVAQQQYAKNEKQNQKYKVQ
ncbi:MAG: hypothetical protein NVSMB46_05480 [Candidatus Saccharimonadales bacterium]